MKKTIVLFCISACISIAASAQIKKGATLLGIDFSLNGTSTKQDFNGTETKNSANGFNTAILAGTAVKENIFVGGSLSYSTNAVKTGTPEVKQTNNTFGASVWARRYFPVFGPVYVFVNGSLYGNSGKTSSTDANGYKANNFGLGVSVYPGVSLQVKKSFFVDASLTNLASIYYNHTTAEQTIGTSTMKQKSNSYGFSTSLGNSSNALQLGLRWIIPAKK